MKLYRVEHILKHLNCCIENDLPFSLIRFGDGGLKILHAFFTDEQIQMERISFREGIPLNCFGDLIKLWACHSRRANYIDTPQVYFSNYFWARIRNPRKSIQNDVKSKIKQWKLLYKLAGIENECYCNPEVNYLMCLDDRLNIIELMKNRKVAIITAAKYLGIRLRNYGYDVDIIEIVGQNENQYENSFERTVDTIKNTVNDYDFWLVAAGELGRLYTGLIKDLGGRATDLGFVADYWCGERPVQARMYKFMRKSDKNELLLTLTDEGKIYSEYI